MEKMAVRSVCLLIVWTLLLCLPAVAASGPEVKKPSPDEILKMLSQGNERHVGGGYQRPHATPERIKLAAKESQSKHALATILSCSDSRVPVELVFDSGIMDLFVIRVAGNVANTDEIGTIEYGLAHVLTPLLVIMGHSQCGAVTAVTEHALGKGHALERNIPPLVAPIGPAVKRAIGRQPALKDVELVNAAIEENVWQAAEDLFIKSAATRNLVKSGKVKVVGAIYDMHDGKVSWLDEKKVQAILTKAEADPKRATNPMYEESKEQKDGAKPEAKHESKPEAKAPAKAEAKAEPRVDFRAEAKAALADDLKSLQQRMGEMNDKLAGQVEKAVKAMDDRQAGLQKETASSLKDIDARMAGKVDSLSSSLRSWVMILGIGGLVLFVVVLVLALQRTKKLSGMHEELRQKTIAAIKRIQGSGPKGGV